MTRFTYSRGRSRKVRHTVPTMASTTNFSLTATPGRQLPIAVRAEGCRIWTEDGREFIDACGGAMVMSVGHCHPRLIEALKRQADEVTFTYRFAFSNKPLLELADLIREISPMARTWSFFNSSGSESVESAIHLALLYWQLLGQPGKTEFISRYPSYHGSTIAALGLSGTSRRDSFEALLTKNAVAQTPNADIRARRTPADEVEFAIKQIEDAIALRGVDNIAGIFLEPITGASGAAVTPPDGYLQRVRELCTRHGLLMICDETITGFGRTGTWFGVEQWGVAPDVITFAKGVTSGVLPFSGMLVAGDVADVLMASPDGFPVGHTFSGYPLGCAVGAEMVRVIRDERLLENARVMGQRLRDGLEAIAATTPHIGDVRGMGLMQGIEFVEDRESLAPRAGAAARVTAAARDRQLMIYSCPTALGSSVLEAVLLAPPLNITSIDVDQILDRLSDAIGAA
ncbi:MAG: aspartate aminotransferase family protein [Thermoleophilia bacterium]|nr:aspartate aminotransferase family protein [Thermoleophilia bacterium]